MNVQAQNTFRGTGTTVRDVLVAKAIRSGYNPYCRSTDKEARTVTEEMRAKTQHIRVPEAAPLPRVRENKPVVREGKATPQAREPRMRREVIALENFELVKRKSPRMSLGLLVSVLVTGIVLAMVVYSGSLINEEARRYSDLSDTLTALQEENKTLTLALAEKNDLVVIEDVAKNELGMVKVAEAEQKYIDLGTENAVQTFAVEQEDAAASVHLLNTFGEKINDFLEYLD